MTSASGAWMYRDIHADYLTHRVLCAAEHDIARCRGLTYNIPLLERKL